MKTPTPTGDRRPEDVLDDVYRRFSRQRSRRRKAAVTVSVAAIAAAALTVVATTGSKTTHTVITTSPGRRGSLPGWQAAGPPRPAPRIFVDGNNDGGIGVWSTTTGALIRSLAAQTAGGPDQQPQLAPNGRTVSYAQPTGACTGLIRAVALTGTRPPSTVISEPGHLALEPAPSPNGQQLAWVEVTCGPHTTTDRLYVTDVATGVGHYLGPFHGDNSDDGISWSPDGRTLAVEDGRTIALVDVSPTSSATERTLPTTAGCSMSTPTYLPHSPDLGVIQTCTTATGHFDTSRALALNPSGRPVAVIANAPADTKIDALTVDPSGQHILLDIQTTTTGTSYAAQLIHGQLHDIGSAPASENW